MTHEIKYRLNEYVIIEHGGISLSWVSHTAIGAELNGRCFIIGNILLIGPKEHEEAGFLKLEFHERLMKLPPWAKTTFYCFASSIRKVNTGKSIISDLEENPHIHKKFNEAVNTIGPGVFRLGRYKITVDQNNIITWQTIGEAGKIISGKCFIESGILFIGPKENKSENEQSRRDFFTGQKLLEKWDKTFAWGQYGSLMKWKEPERQRSYVAVGTSDDQKINITNIMPFSQSQEYSRKRGFHEYTVSGTKRLKTTWHRIVGWDAWKRLAPLFITAFRFSVFLTRKCVSVSIRIIKRFRPYHKE
jgi:hypothetical protein